MHAASLIDFLTRQTKSERENDRLHADLERVWGIAGRATKQRDEANERADRAEAERDALRAEVERLAERNGRLIARLDQYEPVEFLP